MIYKQFFLFFAIGLGCTLIQYFVLIGLTEYIGVVPALSSSIGYLLSATINYMLNRRFTFCSKKKHSESAPMFFVISISGLAINGGIMYLAQFFGNIHYMIAQVFSTFVILFWNFFANRSWTFNSKRIC